MNEEKLTLNAETDSLKKMDNALEISTGADTRVLPTSLKESADSSSENELKALMAATIMMIDDEPSTLEILQLFLEDSGYKHFIKITDSTVAMERILNERPDAVLLDLMMPVVSGFDILSELRTDEALKHIPVIVLTSSTDSDTKLKALELGANDFLAKPVDSSELALRLRNTLAAKAYLDRLADCDPLTGLNNRKTFIDHVDWALLNAKRQGKSCAILQINLDRFKQLNDTLGPRVGDALLKEVARKLEQSVRSSDSLGRSGEVSVVSLCRVGGDEFTVLLSNINNEENAALVARRILAGMEQPFNPEGHEFFITARIGIAIFENDGNETNTLLKHANVAMSQAKLRGGNTYEFYSKKHNRKSTERLSMSNQLRKVLDQSEMEMYYQPKVSIETQQIMGAEALMRWIHPARGIVSPTVFIPIAEDIGVINALGEWALNTACMQTKAWQMQGSKDFCMAVNVSGQQFQQGSLVRTVQAVLAKTKLEPKHLELELTESLIMDNAAENIEALAQLKEIGLTLSIDDFGTGFSSLSYLTAFPVDVLKIDRSFVIDIPEKSNNVAVVKAIVGLAHSLNLKLVAEGVETEEQLQFLASIGCDLYQGFLFSKPVPADEFTRLLFP